MNVKQALERGRGDLARVTVWYKGENGPLPPREGSYGCMVTLLPYVDEVVRGRAMAELATVVWNEYPERAGDTGASRTVTMFNDHALTTREEAVAVYDEAIRRVS